MRQRENIIAEKHKSSREDWNGKRDQVVCIAVCDTVCAKSFSDRIKNDTAVVVVAPAVVVRSAIAQKVKCNTILYIFSPRITFRLHTKRIQRQIHGIMSASTKYKRSNKC